VANEFCPLLEPYAGRPVTYVEIGVFAASSARWVARNILTHPRAAGHGIDPYQPDRKRGRQETAEIQLTAVRRMLPYRWTWHFQPSQQVLRRWPGDPIDILYVDGSHYASDVLTDFVLAFPYLRRGALVVFDDYGRHKQFPHVRDGVQAILTGFEGYLTWATPPSMQAAFHVWPNPSQAMRRAKRFRKQ
jgi:predicted O-methyltransferase YrrM